MSRILALDVGDRRIGVAACEWSDLVTPVGVIARGTGDLEAIAREVGDRSIDLIVVGLPISLDDTIGTQARATLKFIERLKRVVKIPIETVDERFTSVDAEAKLVGMDVTRAKRRRTLDAHAAAEILNGYLSGAGRPTC